jgi:hypothetical protein
VTWLVGTFAAEAQVYCTGHARRLDFNTEAVPTAQPVTPCAHFISTVFKSVTLAGDNPSFS